MSSCSISQLNSCDTLNGTELFLLSQQGKDRKIALSEVEQYLDEQTNIGKIGDTNQLPDNNASVVKNISNLHDSIQKVSDKEIYNSNAISGIFGELGIKPTGVENTIWSSLEKEVAEIGVKSENYPELTTPRVDPENDTIWQGLNRMYWLALKNLVLPISITVEEKDNFIMGGDSWHNYISLKDYIEEAEQLGFKAPGQNIDKFIITVEGDKGYTCTISGLERWVNERVMNLRITGPVPGEKFTGRIHILIFNDNVNSKVFKFSDIKVD